MFYFILKDGERFLKRKRKKETLTQLTDVGVVSAATYTVDLKDHCLIFEMG